MPYTVHQLAKLAGVSPRTLHYYDQLGLLKPARQQKNGYRLYGQAELLHLQQILFFRELEFPLEDIKRFLQAPDFDRRAALNDQRRLLELKKKRLNNLIKTIDDTLNNHEKIKTMTDQDLYSSFSKEEEERYAAEAKERWGHTEAYRQSQERVAQLGKDGMARVQAEAEQLMAEIAANTQAGPSSEVVQRLIDRHYNHLRNFYEPSLEMYRGLGQMYVSDPRFTAYYEKYQPGLAAFMCQAIEYYCDSRQK
jgi:DNA-binding transcriptional MerR regulator